MKYNQTPKDAAWDNELSSCPVHLPSITSFHKSGSKQEEEEEKKLTSH